MHYSEAFPEDILREIRSYPGNNQCCDCRSLDTDWCSVSHGTLICLECAGKHRSLGVLVSFVRSISMDSWSKQQVEMMRQGGNEQIKRFFRKLEIENSPIITLYCSKGANHYRERLKEKVGKIMSGELKSESRVLSKSNHHRNTKSQSAISDLMSSESGQKRRPSIYFYNVSFADGPMGMTISKDFGGRALVSKLVTGGAAECCGVRIGDHISGIAKKRVDDYDEIMHMIPCMTRPILIQFSRRTMGHHAPGTTTVNVEFASPGKNRSLHGSKSMASMSINTQTVEGASNKNKPKIRSPRQQPSLGVLDNIEEGDEDMFNSPKAGKLVSYRSKSKDSPEWSAAAKMNFSDDTPTSVLAMSAESSQTDANQCSSPAASLKGTSGHTTTVSAKSAVADVLLEEVPLETPRQSPRKGPAHPSVDEEFSITASTSREFPPLSLELCKQIDEMLISPVGSGSSKKMDFIVSNGQQPSSSEEVFSPHCDRLSDEHVLFAGEGSTRKLTLQPGTPIKVLRNELWRSAIMRRRHKDGSYKVTFRDGSSEARVSVQRIALTVDTLRALADWHTCTSTTDAYSEEHLDAVYRATTEDAGDGLHHHHELPLSSPDCSFRMLASTDNVHSFVSEDMPLDADKDLAHEYEEDFVAQGSEDLNSWIESEDGEFERGRLSSIDSVLSADGNSAVPYRSSKSFLLSPREKDFSYIVATFQQAPLGLRLSSSRSGNTGGLMSGNSLSSYSYTLHADQQAEVTKVVSGGRAELVGVQLGDALMQVEGRPVRDYTEAMAALQGCAYPLTLQFRRNCGTHASNSISASTHSSMCSQGLVGNILDSMGLQKGPPLSQSPPQVRRLASKRVSIPAMQLPSDSDSADADASATAGGVDASVSVSVSGSCSKGTSHSPSVSSAVSPAPVHASASSAPASIPASVLSQDQSDEELERDMDGERETAGASFQHEFEVLFHEYELGITLIELAGSHNHCVSLVSEVHDNTSAHRQGVPVDCIIVCINDEPYISHSHTISTLKHAKRPVKLRFRR